MQDTEIMTLGMWVDYIIEYNNMHESNKIDAKTGKQVKTRRAVQADFDAF
jgi:hypothetical protein